ncbi:LLM class flavin-dependent oxidoreductase [Microbacterium sp. NPDC064584]|uniref:LLM class flavin-dependent oxidoreductase n=1 Tax=Microbacterium sp. NPDC064584 TaxID=3155817 RepID=UPI0034357451
MRHPLMLAKQAASIDVLSGGRLILGVATGDRPEEYPAFDADFEERGRTYRESVARMRAAWVGGSSGGRILPELTHGSVPLVAVGRGQQTTEWAAQNMDGYVTYHRPGPAMAGVVSKWNASTPPGERKPVITTMLVDLEEDPHTPLEPIRFGARSGRHALREYLLELQKAGVAHVALNFRPSRRPVEDVLVEIAESLLPAFDHSAD